MRIIIQTPQVEAGESLLSFVQENVGKLSAISERLQEARLTLKLGKSTIRRNKICEIRGVISGKDLFAEIHANTFKEASIGAVEAIARQITDWKSKATSQRESPMI